MNDFRFKQFGISQDRCAMKVGTDGVLLGAWAGGGSRILDVGTGTGLIALMMAQRFPDAQVVGIDIDRDACSQARDNVAQSPFALRISIVECSLQEYLISFGCGYLDKKVTEEDFFDAIVSNPPFFVNCIKNPDTKRAMARHTDTLSFHDLWQGVKRLLSAAGIFSVVLPAEVKDDFVAEGCMSGFYLIRECAVKTVVHKAPKRYLLSFSRVRKNGLETALEVMVDEQGSRSEWYRKITDEFYL